MNLIEMLLLDLDREAIATRKVLERVPEGREDWKPHEKSMALGYLANLVATIPAWLAMIVNRDRFEISSTGGGKEFPFEVAKTRQELLAAHERAVKTAREVLEGTTVEHLAKPWAFALDGAVVLQQPRDEAIRDTYYHSAHHRGQLTVYLRMNGEKVPAIYGPSADEGPGRG